MKKTSSKPIKAPKNAGSKESAVASATGAGATSSGPSNPSHTGAQFADPDAGALGSYLAKIRRDGVPKYADMKLRIDQLRGK